MKIKFSHEFFIYYGANYCLFVDRGKLVMKHSVRITRPTGDQRLVKCSCGWYSWCLYPYEARGDKASHLARVVKASLASSEGAQAS